MKLTPVTYVGSHDEVEVPSVGAVCKRGATVEVPAAIAASLLEQTDNWQPEGAIPARTAIPGEVLPPLPDSAYPPGAEPLPEPELEQPVKATTKKKEA